MDQSIGLRIVEELKRGWKAYASIGLILLTVVALFQWRENSKVGDWVAIDATITRFGTSAISQSYQPNITMVYIQTPDGIVGVNPVTAGQITGCKVGDKIAVEQLGLSFRLKAQPCKEN